MSKFDIVFVYMVSFYGELKIGSLTAEHRKLQLLVWPGQMLYLYERYVMILL